MLNLTRWQIYPEANPTLIQVVKNSNYFFVADTIHDDRWLDK